MGCPVQRQRLQASSCSRITVRKRRLRLGSATRSHFPAPPRRLKFSHRSLHGVARTKEQSQRRVRSLVLKMVFNDRPTLKDGHARISSWPGELVSTQRPYTFAQTCLLAQTFPLQSCGGPYISRHTSYNCGDGGEVIPTEGGGPCWNVFQSPVGDRFSAPVWKPVSWALRLSIRSTFS